MSVKAFNISVELDVQAVTCPGVWLCPNGKIILKLCMFGSSARTSRVSPIFPLLYHQKFIFQKTFQNVRYLTDLQHLLGKEFIHAELMQCSDGIDVILASFETTVFELLYPSPCVKSLIAGVDVDLLMAPTKCFPGILAPKIQVSTNTMIEEVVDTSPFHKRNPGLINPKMLNSKYSPDSKRHHQRKVCHGKDQLCKSPKLRENHLHSNRLFCKQNRSIALVPNADDNSSTCNCGHFKVETSGISPLRSQSVETLQDSPTHLPIWTSASGRLYNPCSHCNNIKDSALGKEEHETKWRKTRKDHHYKTCYCCKCDESHNHMTCNCPVCCTYKTYFDKHRADGCPAKQARKPCKHACFTSKKCKQSEFHSFLDRCHCTSDEVRMTRAVHQRVRNNLNASRYYPFIGDSGIPSSLKYPCNISEQKEVPCCGKSQYREEFYHDLEKFYRKLHKWVKQGASEDV